MAACRIELKALQGVDEWLEEYRRLWEESFDRLEVYLQELQAEDQTAREPKAKRKEKKGVRKK
jgi:hypothetical protein